MGEGNVADDDGQFDKAPYFNHDGDKVNFDTNWVKNYNQNYGSVSFFLPKSFLKTGKASFTGCLLPA